MRSVVQGLQQQVEAMRSQPVVSENQTPENGAVNENELVQVTMQLQNDVRILQNRPRIPIVAQPPAPIPIGTPHGEYAILWNFPKVKDL
jgi:hypothetical protein